MRAWSLVLVGSVSAPLAVCAPVKPEPAPPVTAALTREPAGAPEPHADPRPRATPTATLHAAPPTITALRDRVYVRKAARWDSPEIGSLGAGRPVLLREPEPVSAAGCAGGWYAVVPEGFVCHGASTTLDSAHPAILTRRARPIDFGSVEPYRWSESLGAPQYRMPDLALAPANGQNAKLSRVKMARKRSTLAWNAELDYGGRSWLVTSELLLVPKERTRALEPSQFEGVDLTGVTRPLAFVVGKPRTKLQLRGARLTETPERWERLTGLGLTGRSRVQGGRRYLETTDAGHWIRESDATVVPISARPAFLGSANEKWIDVSIARGTLVAYEGARAVFATLISPGYHGYRREGKPTHATTPTGVFRIDWKHRTLTLSPDPNRETYFLSEVPYVQFFDMPYALHAAYWHDRFGEHKSGGCVNLSPRDARRLFEWTDPPVPPDWHGVRAGDARGRGTWVRVR